MGSVDSFWHDFPRLHTSKIIFDGSIELGFLVKGSYVLWDDSDFTCEDTVFVHNNERIRLSLILMIFIHALHLCRLIFQNFGRYQQIPLKGCMQCILVDCYCCAGTIVYLYVQISWWMDHGQCKEQLPHITKHMQNEIIYQYARILWYILTNLIVVLYIMYIQRKFENNQSAEYKEFMAQKNDLDKSEKLSVELSRIIFGRR